MTEERRDREREEELQPGEAERHAATDGMVSTEDIPPEPGGTHQTDD